MMDRANLMKAELVTTAKDYVRLLGMGKEQEELAEKSSIVHVALKFEDDNVMNVIIDKAIENYKKRKLSAKNLT